MADDLEGKVIVVTGGGDGIGRECALAYAREKGVVVILEIWNRRSGRRPIWAVRTQQFLQMYRTEHRSRPCWRRSSGNLGASPQSITTPE